MNADLSLAEVALRLGAAAASGMIVGANRDLHGKPIGMRTLGLVSLGCAIVSLSGVHFQNLIAYPDPLSRVVQGIIQGIMAGISFIGAGVILRDHGAQQVHGLTTAATVWVTAALGIACALADWKVVIVGLILALVLLVLVYWIEQVVAARAQK
jgi:putative Mg2+ transporter-C (MgtC) family protein